MSGKVGVERQRLLLSSFREITQNVSLAQTKNTIMLDKEYHYDYRTCMDKAQEQDTASETEVASQ